MGVSEEEETIRLVILNLKILEKYMPDIFYRGEPPDVRCLRAVWILKDKD